MGNLETKKRIVEFLLLCVFMLSFIVSDTIDRKLDSIAIYFFVVQTDNILYKR